MKQILTELKEETECNSFILGDFNTPLTPKDISTRQKISKDTEALNNILEQMDLIDIYRTLHPKATGYTFFSSAHGTFSRIDHILGHKKSLSKFQKTEILPTNFSDHKGIKVEINCTKKAKRLTNTWRLNNMLLVNGSTTKLKWRSSNIWKQMTTTTQSPKFCWTGRKQS